MELKLTNKLKEYLAKKYYTDKSLIYHFSYDKDKKKYKVVFHSGTETYVKYVSIENLFSKSKIRRLKLENLLEKIRKF